MQNSWQQPEEAADVRETVTPAELLLALFTDKSAVCEENRLSGLAFLPLLNELEWNVKTSSLLEFAGQMRLFVDADLSVGTSSQTNAKCDSE